jgi:parallel beta-helix repeat protein
MKHILGALAGACLLGPCAFATTPTGNTLYVANNGLDTPVCGSPTDPCRSISQGIVNAAAGDTLVVRPGKYGENGSGSVDQAGEEFGSTIPGSVAGVYVNKPLTIISSAGAEATLIDVVGTSSVAVQIAADGVTFGARGAGFTITGAQDNGLEAIFVNDVTIAGNIASKNRSYGFAVLSSGVVEVRANSAFGNGSGFVAFQSPPGAYVRLVNNISIGNTYGMTSRGPASPHQIIGNELTGNDIGLDAAFGPLRIAQNNITGNTRGLEFLNSGMPTPSPPLVVHNNVFGNKAYGVEIFEVAPGGLPKLRENNIFGNGLCGTHNRANEALDARHNFWGAAAGPSDSDPADNACAELVPTLTTPFATSEFAVR